MMLLVLCPLSAQEQLDSLIYEFEHSEEGYEKGLLAGKIGKMLEPIDLERSKPYFDQALEIGRANGYEDLMGDAFRMLALYHYTNGNFEKSLQLNDSAFAHYVIDQDSGGLVAVYNNQGLIYRQNGECLKATEVALEAIKINDRMGDLSLGDSLMLNYVEILWNCQQYEEALEYGRKGLNRVRSKGNRYLEGQFLATMGSIYFQLEIDDSCAIYYELALQISQELNDDYFYAASLNNLGLIYMYTENYAEAESLFLKSYELDEAHGNYKRHASTYVNLGVLAGFQKDYPKAIQYYLRGIELVDRWERDIYLIDIYQELGKAYQLTRQDPESFKYYDLAYDLQDSLLSANIQSRIKELDKKFQTEKVEKQLIQSQINAQRSRNKLILVLLGSVGASLMAFFIYLFILSSVNKRKAEEERRRIQLEYFILQAQMNPHFIFNSLNSIQGFFAENDFEKGNEYLGAFGKLIRRVMEQSAFELISLEQELETLFLYVQLEQLRLQGQLYFEVFLGEGVDPRQLQIPPLILQPFVENAIWHGIVPKKAAGKVTIFVNLADDGLAMNVRIEDDGVGLNSNRVQPNKSHQSKGVQITRERLGEEGSLQLENMVSEEGNIRGTRVRINIPLELAASKNVG